MKKKIFLTVIALVTICVVYFGIQFKDIFNIIEQMRMEKPNDFSSVPESDVVIDDIIISDTNNDTENVDNSVTEEIPNKNALPSTDDKPQKPPKQPNEVISNNKINNVADSMSFADKAEAVKLIISALSSSDIETLKELASGGLTAEEKKKAVEIAYSKYSAEEIEIIKTFYNKYIGMQEMQ